jgi:hypothetical protein
MRSRLRTNQDSKLMMPLIVWVRESVRLSRLRGSKLPYAILHYWATMCVPLRSPARKGSTLMQWHWCTRRESSLAVRRNNPRKPKTQLSTPFRNQSRQFLVGKRLPRRGMSQELTRMTATTPTLSCSQHQHHSDRTPSCALLSASKEINGKRLGLRFQRASLQQPREE